MGGAFLLLTSPSTPPVERGRAAPETKRQAVSSEAEPRGASARRWGQNLLVPLPHSRNPSSSPAPPWFREQALAARAAIPLLQASGGGVAILCVAERNRRAVASEAVEYLRWHGIDATVAAPTAEHVGAQLLAFAHERGAGLIVSGAYSHSRLRQLLFGGVTGHLVERADLPVLFAG